MSERVRIREGWLLESLRRAAEEAALLPAWAIAINRAYDQQYRPAPTPRPAEGPSHE